LKRMIRIALGTVLLAGCTAARAQQHTPYQLDLAVSYIGEYALHSDTAQNFWLQGGMIELGTNTYKGFGIAASIAGSHASSIGSGGVPLSIVSATFGPRYRWHANRSISIYVEGLAGEADGFDSLFPATRGAQTSANGLATQVGGGIDYKLSPRLAIRALEAAWVRTQLPNATISVEDDFRVGAGFVLKFGH
jgi:hypothetical protein